MVTFQQVVDAGTQAAPYAAALAGGVLLQKFFNVVAFVSSFFVSKPDVLPALVEVIKDVVEKQNDLQADILKLLQAINASQKPAS